MVNRSLLGSPVTRPLYLAMWVPNGLIVGCEALFVPFAGHRAAGWLFAAAAAGMLIGDVVIGRIVPPRRRERLVHPLRVLLAASYLVFFFDPSIALALALTFVASAGFAAALPLQERLISATAEETRGQAFGLYSTGLMVGQALGAAAAGAVAEILPPPTTMGSFAVLSLASTAAFGPALRRSAPVTVEATPRRA